MSALPVRGRHGSGYGGFASPHHGGGGAFGCGQSPYGTVAAILPYDASPVMVARVGGAAILGGNQFRFSCSSQAPRTARLLQELVAGLPGFTAGGPGQPGVRPRLRR